MHPRTSPPLALAVACLVVVWVGLRAAAVDPANASRKTARESMTGGVGFELPGNGAVASGALLTRPAGNEETFVPFVATGAPTWIAACRQEAGVTAPLFSFETDAHGALQMPVRDPGATARDRCLAARAVRRRVRGSVRPAARNAGDRSARACARRRRLADRPTRPSSGLGAVGGSNARDVRVRNVKLRKVMIIGALTGALGCASAPPPSKTAPPAVAAAPAGAALVPEGPPVERIAVPLGGPARGPATAKVTIVEFSDFQCPFCARVNATLEQLLRDYPNNVRILFRHNPLPFHNNAAPAAEAAVAAKKQGKFWEMHDKLFADQSDLERPALELHAVQLGLDLTAFRAALDTHAGKARVDEDLALGRQLGVRGTPNFFINGRSLIGRAADRRLQADHRR